MSLVKWTPRPGYVDRSHDVFDRILSEVFDSARMVNPPLGSEWVPETDIFEEDSRFVVHLDVPGMNRKDISVAIADGTLTVKGKRAREQAANFEGYQRYERHSGSFQRTFTLPSTVDASKIDASYKNGVLTLMLPKSDAARPKEIDIKVN